MQPGHSPTPSILAQKDQMPKKYVIEDKGDLLLSLMAFILDVITGTTFCTAFELLLSLKHGLTME
jgi:hypothetical protein